MGVGMLVGVRVDMLIEDNIGVRVCAVTVLSEEEAEREVRLAKARLSLVRIALSLH